MGSEGIGGKDNKSFQFLAKSRPPQTIYEHTERLRLFLIQLRDCYGPKMVRMNERAWELLKIAVDYHDVGKADSLFQNSIQQQLKEKRGLIPQKALHNEKVPHNYLSVGLIPFRELGITKTEMALLAQVVGYHHERETPPNVQSIREILENDIRLNLGKLAEHTGLAFPEKFYYTTIRGLDRRLLPPFKGDSVERLQTDIFWDYVMLKGLLHRLDHTASDSGKGIVIEDSVNEHIGDYVGKYFKVKGFVKNELQNFAEAHVDKNIIAVAQTGMGKTEAALCWVGKDKAFFTLPLRVSANAIYDRISGDEGMVFSPVGILHSTSVDQLIEKNDNWEQIINQSRHLADKLTITTIDQVLKFPFFYKGFEKELATLAYSKVIIDEIQAYDPKIVAMLIKALEMIHFMGGKFMIMTATLPPIYLEKLRERGYIAQDTLVERQFIDDKLLRHRIELRDMPIIEAVDEIVDKGKEKQVLVIVNTVGQSIRLYEAINALMDKKGLDFPLHLLHGRFALGHRQQLENLLRNFNRARPKPPGIWITTQIVEASLDIDFEYLFTELSTLDSLFQRLGRCYRKRILTAVEANIKVFTREMSGIGHVYNKYLVEEGLSLLRPYHNESLTEKEKVKLVEDLYSHERLKGTKFLEELEKSLDWFDDLEPYNFTKNEAQEKMRAIQQVMIIPSGLWPQVETTVDSYKGAANHRERYLLKRKIEQFTVPVWTWKAQKMYSEPLAIRGLEHISCASVEYDFCPKGCKGRGLLLGDSSPKNQFL